MQTEVDSEKVCTILAAMCISFMASIQDQLPAHSKQGREIKRLEGAITRVAKLHSAPLEEKDITIGVECWKAAVEAMQKGLSL